MKTIDWQRFKGLGQMLAIGRHEPTRQAERIVAMQRNIVLPAKFGLILVVLYYFYYSGWSYEFPSTRSVWQDTLKQYFPFYVLCNFAAYVILIFWRRFPADIFQWVAFTLGLLDGLFAAGLTIVTGGFESIMIWVFPALIVINAISIPLAMPQILLNLLLSFFYIGAVIQNPKIGENQTALISVPLPRPAALRGTNQVSRAAASASRGDAPEGTPKPRRKWWEEEVNESEKQGEISIEPFVMRVAVLWLLTICCYGVRVLAERQRRAEEEAHEMGLRQGQLRSAGRIAAEFAHQIKNPLAIINNAVFSVQRSMQNGGGDMGRQLEIIKEEIERSDKIITQIMGYAQLNEGQIERLDLEEALNRAVRQAFPPGAEYPVRMERRIEPGLPPLLMQRNHLDEILVNLLQNARDALGAAGGKISAVARRLSENLIEISISDTGQGIPPEKLERIFEAHYTTKAKGSGLGLAIVRHNAELYAGTVRAESKLGKGARFVLIFPAKTVLNMK